MITSFRRAFLFGVFLALHTLFCGKMAYALTSSCQEELDKHGAKRMQVINRINGFAKKRPTPKQACGAFNDLVKVEASMLKWMEDNLSWCQIPDTFVEDFRKGSGQGVSARDNTCAAAKKYEQQMRQQQAAPRPSGGGVALPKGAL